jgi:hypothetical protein
LRASRRSRRRLPSSRRCACAGQHWHTMSMMAEVAMRLRRSW